MVDGRCRETCSWINHAARKFEKRYRIISLHRELVCCVECGNLVTLGESRIVEHGGEEVVQTATESKHCLPDVKQLGGASSDDVHAKQRSLPAMKEHL